MKTILFVFAMFIITLASHAGVSLKNGNFFIGYLDIYFPGGFEPQIQRVYNSKSEHVGWFGLGWGSDYKTYLVEMADGSIIIKESGGGSRSHFRAANYSKDTVSIAADKIIEAMKKKTPMSADEVGRMKKLLVNDAFKRQQYSESYGIKSPIPAGTAFNSYDRGVESLKKLENGFVRITPDGRGDYFNEAGRLVKIIDRNKNWLTINYGKNGLPVSIKDSLNRQIDLTFNTEGRIIGVSSGNKKASYEYKDGELIKATDVDGNTFTYGYSSDKRHNLVKIGYSDNTSLQIFYYPKEKFELTSKIIDRDGTITEYNYGDISGPEHYFTEVLIKDKAGQLTSKAKYEYLIKRKIDGQEFTKQMKTDINGDVTINDYNEMGLPETITRNGRSTTFKYSPDGYLIHKESPYEVSTLSYDKKWGKVNKVEKYLKADKTKKKTWATYEYDERGNLKTAATSEGKKVAIAYNSEGRIHTMIDQAKRKLSFTYTSIGKPQTITDSQVGTMTINYTPGTDNIESIQPPSGDKITNQVSASFQNLLEIIKPAGVSLGAN